MFCLSIAFLNISKFYILHIQLLCNLKKFFKSLDLAERRNGDQRRLLATYTKKGFAIVEYVKDGRYFRVPDRLRWELKPHIVGMS